MIQQPKPEYSLERKRRAREKQAAKSDFQRRIKELDCGFCQNPNCRNSWYFQTQVQVHHIKYISDGGKHEDHNGICLCAVCHREAHRARSWMLALLIRIRGEHLVGWRASFRWQPAIDDLENKQAVPPQIIESEG